MNSADAAALDAFAHMPGFGAGVHVMTPGGELPVDWLVAGDRVMTRDHGAQPILWIGRVRFDQQNVRDHPDLAPVEIAGGALAPICPTHPTRLSKRSRILLAGADLQLHVGVSEALAEIGTLGDDRMAIGPTDGAYSIYTYFLLPMHEAVIANGLWSETLLLDRATFRAVRGVLPKDLLISRDLAAGHRQTFRMCLSTHEICAMQRRTSAEHRPDMLRLVA